MNCQKTAVAIKKTKQDQHWRTFKSNLKIFKYFAMNPIELNTFYCPLNKLKYGKVISKTLFHKNFHVNLWWSLKWYPKRNIYKEDVLQIFSNKSKNKSMTFWNSLHFNEIGEVHA
jgi:hypothetical protein